MAGFGVTVGSIACAPLASLADETTARKAKKTAKLPVEYETFSDPKEHDKYLKNARDKLVKLRPGEAKKLGRYIKSCSLTAMRPLAKLLPQ